MGHTLCKHIIEEKWYVLIFNMIQPNLEAANFFKTRSWRAAQNSKYSITIPCPIFFMSTSSSLSCVEYYWSGYDITKKLTKYTVISYLINTFLSITFLHLILYFGVSNRHFYWAFSSIQNSLQIPSLASSPQFPVVRSKDGSGSVFQKTNVLVPSDLQCPN